MKRAVCVAALVTCACGASQGASGPSVAPPTDRPPAEARATGAADAGPAVEARGIGINDAGSSDHVAIASPGGSSGHVASASPDAGVASSQGRSRFRSTLALAGQGRLDGGPDEAELAAGDDAFDRGDLGAAESCYRAAHASASLRVAADVGLARVRIARLGVPLDYGAAKDDAAVVAAAAVLDRAAKADPSFGPAFVELGRARLLLADAPGAIDALRTGARLLPDVPEAHSQLGVAWLATGHPDEAVRELTRAVELDPEDGARHGNLGTALLMAGRTPQAVAEYETRVRLDDGDARAHSDLGTALLGTQDLERALGELRRAVQLDPARPSFHSNLGYALQQSGHVDGAIAEYREALRLDPKLVSAWINLGTALARDPRRRDEARAALDRARALSPDDPRVKANLEELDALRKGAPAAPSP